MLAVEPDEVLSFVRGDFVSELRKGTEDNPDGYLTLTKQALESGRLKLSATGSTYVPGALKDLVSFTACHLFTYSMIAFMMLRIYEMGRDAMADDAFPKSLILAGIGVAVFGAGFTAILARRDPQMIAARARDE